MIQALKVLCKYRNLDTLAQLLLRCRSNHPRYVPTDEGKSCWILEKHDFITCTKELWSSVTHDSMLSLTAHCICLEFSRKSCFEVKNFNDSHTGENITNLIVSCFQSWKIENILVYIVRDSGSNFVAGYKMQVQHTHCNQ